MSVDDAHVDAGAAPVAIRRVERPDPPVVAGLAGVLVDCVDAGASVSFMHPLDEARAAAFWTAALEAAARGERIVLVAEDEDGAVVGTVQVVFAEPENQPHRGDVSKLLVHRGARRRGVAEALMRAVEAAALEAGRTLLVLDTASDTAARLYERLGWQRVGVIPSYALMPDGAPCATVVFYKHLVDHR